MKDLLRLYKTHSPSRDTNEMLLYLMGWLTEHNIQYQQKQGCIFNLTGQSGVILSAHMDQVKTNGRAVHFYKKDDCIRGYTEDYEQTNLGADDKNGIWIILKILEQKPDTQFIISTDEEIGCVGIHALDEAKYLDIINPKSNICLVLDRRGYGEILDKGGQGNYCATLAQVLCNYLGEPFRTGTGSASDTGIIADHCESVNIGVGYYNAHQSTEYTNWTELCSIKDKVLDIIEHFTYYPTMPDIYRVKQQDLWGRY